MYGRGGGYGGGGGGWGGRGGGGGGGGMMGSPSRPLLPAGPGAPHGGGAAGGAKDAVGRPPFDLSLCEPMFPKVNELEERALTEALLKRNTELTPTATEQAAVLNLMNKVTTAVEKMIMAPELFTAACIQEARQVGSFKKGTMMSKSNVADVVLVLRTLPTVESVSALGNRICEEIKAAEPKEVLGCVPRDFGCEIAGTTAVIRLLVTTVLNNFNKLEPDLHLAAALLQRHLAAVRHARWFDENAAHTSVKVLVRLLKDIRRRFAGFHALNTWAIELLAHYSVMNTPSRQPLPLTNAFKRSLQLLSAGLLLPGSPGLVDPCEPSARVQHSISLADQDLICSTAQTLLRVVSAGGYKHVLGMEGSATVATEMSVWEGVVVTPLEKAYDASEWDGPPDTVVSA